VAALVEALSQKVGRDHADQGPEDNGGHQKPIELKPGQGDGPDYHA
jgi:hypothetical protein